MFPFCDASFCADSTWILKKRAIPSTSSFSQQVQKILWKRNLSRHRLKRRQHNKNISFPAGHPWLSGLFVRRRNPSKEVHSKQWRWWQQRWNNIFIAEKPPMHLQPHLLSTQQSTVTILYWQPSYQVFPRHSLSHKWGFRNHLLKLTPKFDRSATLLILMCFYPQIACIGGCIV